MVLPLTKKQINLDEDNVKDIEIEIVEMDSPLEDIDYNLLRALYHLGKKFRSDNGFWLQITWIADWLKANNYEMSPESIGKRLKAIGFKAPPKRMSEGIFRWIGRKRLKDLIGAYNSEGIDVEEVTNRYEEVKVAVFRAILDKKDATELGYDLTLVQKATGEFVSMEIDDAKLWVDEHA